ncbi:anti-sigma factor [Pseudanabaena sp. 'Roaring Creek']|uniref:anti-sigma factor n=1 Tax=Pseudanabaena sp. 'Roaring Creek' TaxID=1681830 RepID=UPI0006D7799C|nr:anti-sigma factor [Pseudanabaena sp. 'Roaring Creek']
MLIEYPEVTSNLNELQIVNDRLILGLNEVDPPPYLWSNIRDSAYKSLRQNLLAEKHVRRFPWKPILAGAIGLLVLGLGLDNYQLRQALKASSEIEALLQQPKTRLFALKQVNNDKSLGSFVVNLDRQVGILTIPHLPNPPDGHTYRLWAIVDNDKLPCGQLNITSQGKIAQQFAMPVDLYDNGISAVLVTLESSSLSRYPKGTVVMQSEL